MSKSIIYLMVFIGGTIGSIIPTAFGSGYFSAGSIFGGALGSLVGIWVAVKISNNI